MLRIVDACAFFGRNVFQLHSPSTQHTKIPKTKRKNQLNSIKNDTDTQFWWICLNAQAMHEKLNAIKQYLAVSFSVDVGHIDSEPVTILRRKTNGNG